jgi:S-adenosylmethionine:tRNA ribosyltransferase-isomerase
MKVIDFDFSLPTDLIAKRPLQERSCSRLLVLHRNGTFEHKRFSDFPAYLNKGDLVLINNTKVLPAWLTGFKKTGGKIHILLVKEKGDNVWEVLSKGGYTGRLTIAENIYVNLIDGKTAHFYYSGDLTEIIWKYGYMPLPPYIKRLPDESDNEHYQTIFAKKSGSIAAPTAGLHFTYDVVQEIITKGVLLREITLHIGIGTFKPIRTKYLKNHCMETEYFEIDKRLTHEIKLVKASGKKIISIGTTTTRAIEGYISGKCRVSSHNGKLTGSTDIFIYPGYTFRAVDSLLTNFHLPRSTPLMLASAMCNRKSLLSAYKQAIAKRYRFLSYGDAMLIL